MASLIERSKDAAKRRREKEEKKKKAAAAEKGGEKTAPRRAGRVVGGRTKGRGVSGTVKGSAPPPTTTKVRKAGTSKAPPPTTTKGRSAKGTASGTAKGTASGTTGRRETLFERRRREDRAYDAAASGTTKGGSFKDAFAAARSKKGRGKTFTWNGKKYTTDRADDRSTRPSGRAAKKPSEAGPSRQATVRPSGRAAKRPDEAGHPRQTAKRGFFEKFGKGIKDAFVPTDDEPKPPGGKRPDRIQTRRGQPVGPWAKYDERMKFWRARQKNANNKSAGGRVGKPAKKAAKKKAAKKRAPTRRAHKETYVRPGAMVPTKYRGKPLPVKGDANWAAFNADMVAYAQSKPPTSTALSMPSTGTYGMKAGGSVRKPAKKKPLARTSVKTKSPRRP
jgi:hypothetical protein